MKAGLTREQARLLKFLKDYSKKHGFSPSLEEMRLHLSLTTKSGPHRLLGILEDRGHITRIPHCARSIQVIDHAGLAQFSTMDLRRELMRRQTGVAPAADQHA